jgi:choline kinase
METKGVILAAGRGSRMRDLTQERPKCLVEVGGQTLLDRQLAGFRRSGITDIGIVTGYRRELLVRDGVSEFHNARWADTNMVYSLACARAWLERYPCVVSYSDIFFEPSAVASLVACPAPFAITYDPNWLSIWSRRFADPLSDAETFRLGANEVVVEIGNKPTSLEEVEGQYMGLLRFTPTAWNEVYGIFEDLPREVSDRLQMTHLLQKVIGRGQMAVAGVSYRGVWGEIDSPEDLSSYEYLPATMEISS